MNFGLTLMRSRARPRAVALMLAAVALVGCVAAPQGEYESSDLEPGVQVDDEDLALRADGLERQLRQATLRVRNRTCLGVGTGSGFAVGSHLLVTNRHVVRGASRLQVSTWDGHTLDAGVNGYAVTNDLAVVETVQELPETLSLGSAVDPGMDVVAVGYPGGRAIELTDGEVIDFVPGTLFGEATETLRISNRVEQGNSGGPLVDADGAVVGVVFGIEHSTGYGLVVPVDILVTLAEQRGFIENPPAC